MKLLYFVLLLIPAGNAAAQLTDSEILNLKSGLKKDDSSYVYSLPFVRGKSYLLVQGANSKMSHRNELSYDFKMKKGSKICAARGGVVIDARSDSDKGGLKKENLSDGNYIIVQHDDQSKAYYWHLQKDGVLVKAGDVVEKDQLIGYSGNTGYTAFPHLHFQVTDTLEKKFLCDFNPKKELGI